MKYFRFKKMQDEKGTFVRGGFVEEKDLELSDIVYVAETDKFLQIDDMVREGDTVRITTALDMVCDENDKQGMLNLISEELKKAIFRGEIVEGEKIGGLPKLSI